MPIVKYVFVVLAACGREGEFVDSEDEVRVDKKKKKLPTLKEIYNDDSWQKTFFTFDPTPSAFSGPTSGLSNPSIRIPLYMHCSTNFGLPILCVRYVPRQIDMHPR